MDKQNVKIACITNMNNNMFCLVRYLRDMGYDAHLFLFVRRDFVSLNKQTILGPL